MDAMSLNTKLRFLRDSMSRNAGPKVAAACEQAAEIQASLASEDGTVLKCPKTVPDATLVAADGSEVSVLDLIAGKPAALLFFRGDWCPYSTTSMRAYEEVRAALTERGAVLVGITPRCHEALSAAVARNLLGYLLLTDPEQKLAEAMGVRARVTPAMVGLFKSHGVDLAAMNESADWSLPLEATFLVDAEGAIFCANAYPHPAMRLEPSELRDRLLAKLERHLPA